MSLTTTCYSSQRIVSLLLCFVYYSNLSLLITVVYLSRFCFAHDCPELLRLPFTLLVTLRSTNNGCLSNFALFVTFTLLKISRTHLAYDDHSLRSQSFSRLVIVSYFFLPLLQFVRFAYLGFLAQISLQLLQFTSLCFVLFSPLCLLISISIVQFVSSKITFHLSVLLTVFLFALLTSVYLPQFILFTLCFTY